MLFGKKKKDVPPIPEEKQEKPTPAYLRPDYPYQAIGDPITDLDTLEPTGVLYVLEVCAGGIIGTKSKKR